MIQGMVARYRILGQIGSGGMGVVYKAIDDNLRRPVAIKAIRESLFEEPRAKARLRREALAAASLDHPFICKVYELLEHEGQTLVVMEYVEGESLERLLQSGPLPLQDTLRYAGEIAEALGEIHRKGMVHRDVKPANVLITPQRHAKLMDFGIVKGGEAAEEEGATLLTAPEGVVGTPRYMSPEQAVGEPATSRSDIFSLGVVMFHCLTGELPFAGRGRQTYIRGLLTDPPGDLRLMRPDLPDPVSALVNRCLSKDAADRFESGDQVCKALADASAPVPAGSAVRPRALVWLLVGLALLAGLSSWLLWKAFFLGSAADPVLVASESTLVSWPSQETDPRLSPDGQWISFLSDRGGVKRIWITASSGGQPRPLSESSEPPIVSHVWAPDSRRVAYLSLASDRRLLKIVPTFGGPAQLVFPLQEWKKNDADLVRWQGASIFLRMNQQLWKFDVEDRSLHKLNDTLVHSVDVSRDGRKILYSPLSGELGIWLADLDGRNALRLSPPGFAQHSARWAGQNRMVFLSHRTGQMDLWQARAEAGEASARRIASDVEEIGDVSPDGQLMALVRAHENANLWCLDDPLGAAKQLTAETASDFWPSVAGPGSVFAFQRSKPRLELGNRLFDATIYLAQTESCRLSEERMAAEDGYGPQLAPEGNWLAFLRSPNPPLSSALWIQHLSSGRMIRVASKLAPVPFRIFPLDIPPASLTWDPAGKRLYYVASAESGQSEIRVVEPDSDPEASRLLAAAEPGRQVVGLAVSPDSRRLAYAVRLKSRSWSVQALELEAGGGETQIYQDSAADEVINAGWTAGGRSLVLLRCFDNEDGSEQRVEVLESSSGRIRQIGVIERALGSTVRLDPRRSLLYITRIEGLAHNICSFSLEDGQLGRLTDNEFQGRTFSGLQVSSVGHIYYTLQEHNSEILVVRLD